MKKEILRLIHSITNADGFDRVLAIMVWRPKKLELDRF
jgi:hypothetical protein